MAESATTICNKALKAIGDAPITSIDNSDDVNARDCKTFYENTRDALLREHPWNFAQKRAQLERLTETPAFEFDYAYLYPNDCLRIVSIHNSSGDMIVDAGAWVVEDRKILSDEETLYIRYTKRAEDVRTFDPLFIDALAARLAVAIGQARSKSTSLVEQLAGMYASKVSLAKLHDSAEGPVAEEEYSSWEQAKF